jgi:hypothetical protein
VIDGSSVAAVTSSHFVCWNIDASANRGFFARDLDPTKPYGAQLARQAAAIGQAGGGGSHDSSVHSLLRFGGSGNDDLVYQVGGGDTAATAAASRRGRRRAAALPQHHLVVQPPALHARRLRAPHLRHLRAQVAGRERHAAAMGRNERAGDPGVDHRGGAG